MDQRSQTTSLPARLQDELNTIKAMIAIYCRAHHSSTTVPCSACQKLEIYAAKRIRCCPFQEKKPTCGNCTVHCYKPDMREEVRNVMRYAGPRMTFRHPLMALRHLLDSRRPVPDLNTGKQKRRT